MAGKKVKTYSKATKEGLDSPEMVDAPENELHSPTKASKKDSSLTIIDAEIVKPMVSPEQALAAWKAFQDLKTKLLEPSDYHVLQMFQMGKGMVKKPFIKKSGWRKLATVFNLSVEIVSEKRVEYPIMEYKDKKTEKTEVRPGFVVEIVARVTASNGRFMEGTGSCASNERGFAHLEHDMRATAETRAKNRAISDMIGGGEVSAEEMVQMEEDQKNKCIRDHSKLPEKVVVTEGKNKGRPYLKCPSCTFFKWLDQEA